MTLYVQFDIVAVPGKNFSMENWGLLLMDEARIFPDASDSAYRRYLQLDTVCHEAAHQWMGNLVTCPDWMQVMNCKKTADCIQFTYVRNIYS